MFLRVALFLMLTCGIVGAGAIAWVMLAAPAPQAAVASTAAPRTPKIAVIIAAHGLRAGSLIKPEDLATLEILEAEVPAGSSRDTPQGRGSLIGAMIRRSISESQMILPADVVHPGDHGFLAAVLGPDMRAVSVAVDTVSGAAGLIWPGDRVDVILTQALDDPALAAGRRVAAETVLSDARVIAVDQQMMQGQAPEGAGSSANRTATLEVTSAQAERVLVAGRLGKLSLSVLSADRGTVAATEPQPASAPVAVAISQKMGAGAAGKLAGAAGPGRPVAGVTWASDVSPALGTGESKTAPVMVHVFQGGADSKEFHF